MKVLLLSKYPRMGASSRLRSLQYLPALADEGIKVTVSSLFDDEYLKELYLNGRRSKVRSLFLYLKRLLVLLTVFRYDVVWIEKELFPYSPAFFERLLALCGVKYVVDYDDAIFHNYDLAGSSLIRQLLGQKIDVVMAQASCVIAGNQYLADRAMSAGAKRVEVIPTVVDHRRYGVADTEFRRSPWVIGWIGSPSTQQYVVEIAPALRKVCDQYAAKIMMVGATSSVKDSLADLDVEIIPWSESTETELIRLMDVGIMPLRDEPWERGKCGYKLIQYMASSVPVVASPVGVNKDIVGKSKSGLLADSIVDWEMSIKEVLGASDERILYGKNGRAAVENKYSLEIQSPKLVEILRSVSCG